MIYIMTIGNKDVDTLLLQCLKDNDLLSIMVVNKYFYKLCSKIFWINRTKIRYNLNEKDYKYVKRIYPFKKWLIKENFKRYFGSDICFFQRIHNEDICVEHQIDCSGCEFCLYADYGVGLRFLKYCKDNNISLGNHFNLEYVSHANVYELRNKFFKYKTEEIEKILNL